MPFRRTLASFVNQQAQNTISRLWTDKEQLQFELERERTKRMDLKARLEFAERDLNMWRDCFYMNQPLAMIERERRERRERREERSDGYDE